ncbi:hypothetical protein HPB51_010441 [Rhipicephalus microplus]|uniref:Sulfatase N-terminal domain-containing protein n=1 Tax=Rhipicephalus microplus TaxID=6941 RepID=A0A9J6E8G8_RHIMP|nr:hypothetical protein HPB51_010441 [Rhipicephalus microplus]
MGGTTLLCVLAGVVWVSSPMDCAARPNIIVIVADDLGWGDVSFHGSQQIRTPNIDALATDSIVLDNHYVSPLCTPSRATLLSGRHPIHTGLQHNVIYSAMPYAFPLHFKLMPEYFKALGYESHAVGKWHLGHMTRNHTPTRRGFDSFYGYYSGHHGYTDHSAFEEYMDDPKDQWTGWGLDLWHNLQADRSKSGNYTTQLFTEKAIEILKNRDRSKLVEALNATDAIQDTIIALTTDNGAATGGIDSSAGSNWPLRGTKANHWEGGVRGIALVWSPMIRQPRVSRQLMHVSDWLPTLYSAAGGNVEDLGDIDGVDMWRSLVTGHGSPRSEVLHNIDPIWNMSALRVGRYKYLNGTYGDGRYDGWYEPLQERGFEFGLYGVDNTSGDKYGLRHLYDDGNTTPLTAADYYNARQQEPPSYRDSSSSAARSNNLLDRTCAVARTFLSIGRALPKHSPWQVMTECGQPRKSECKPLEKPCLFDIERDPCEIDNIADDYPHVLRSLENRLQQHKKTMVPPLNKPPTRRSDPRYFDFTWAPYMDTV